MANSKESITQLAYKAIDDYDLLVEQCSTAEAVMEYLQDEEHFKELAALLRETMIQAGVCGENDSQNIFVDALYTRLQIQDQACGRPEKINGRKTIRDWLSGSTKSIRNREDVIEICFALKLNLEAATDFLIKCGFNPLNVRIADDAVYLYCLMSNRPLSVAQEIIRKYEASISADAVEDATASKVHSGNTTMLLQKELEGMLGYSASWENDDSFLNSFLLPNKVRFLGYASTAEKEYYLLKNQAYFQVLIDIASEEESHYYEKKRGEELASTIDHWVDTPISSGVKSALEKCDESHLLYPIRKLFEAKKRTVVEALRDMQRVSMSHQDISSQIEIAAVLNDIIKNEGFLKYVISCMESRETGRLRGIRTSKLKDTVMKGFPNDKTFAEFEKNPAKASQKLTTRKAIILMYFISYAYSFSTYLSGSTYSSTTYGLEEFMEALNQILTKCRLSKLYPANQFDWLILRSIREFEVAEDIECEDNPMTFFNKVIAFSFGDVFEDEGN